MKTFYTISIRYLFALLTICLFLFFTVKASAQSQCTDCTSSYNGGNNNTGNTLTGTLCFTEGTNTIQNNISSIADGTIICVNQGATLDLSSNQYNGIQGTVTVNVYGTLKFSTNPALAGNWIFNIFTGGSVSYGSSLEFSGNLTINNQGTFSGGKLAVTGNTSTGTITNTGAMTLTDDLNFAGTTFTFYNNSQTALKLKTIAVSSSSSTLTFRNYTTMNVSSTLNLNNGTAHFLNNGILTIGENYNSSPTSTYVNCGTYTGKFNLNSGGKVINTGTFITSQIDFGSSASKIENYGTFNSSGSINASGPILNAGIFILSSGQLSGDGNLTGPSAGSASKGYFVWSGINGKNSGTIGPNLNFRNSSGTSEKTTMFNNSASTQYTWLSNITWGDTEPTTLPPTDCPLPDGKPNVAVPLQSSACAGVDLTTLEPKYSNVTYEWWTGGTSTEKGTQITTSTTPSVSNFTTSGITVYLWAKNIFSGVYSNAGAAVNISTCLNFWKGSNDPSTGTDWNTAANWTAGKVPAENEDIVFATAVNNNGSPAINDLVVPAGAAKNIGKLTNDSEKALIIPAGTSVTANGSVSGFDATPEKLRLLAEAGKANGTFIALDNCNTTVLGTVQLYAKGKKGEKITWTDNIEGSPTKDQSFTSSYQWQFFGVPVETVKASPTFDGGFLRKYNEAINKTSGNSSNSVNGSYYYKWETLNNASDLTAFTGYEITQDNPTTYTIKGRLQLCDKTIKLTRSAVEVPGSTDSNEANKRYGLGQNIFGNSFTAAIPVKDLTFPSNVEQTVYLYNTGSFANWTTGSVSETTTDAGSYLSIPYNTSSALDAQIPSMQGFLLLHTGTIGTTIDMTLPYARLTKNLKPQTAPRKALSYLHINLTSNSTRDNLWLFSQQGTTGKLDDGWDGRKFFGTPTAFIYTENADGPMQVNTDQTIDGTVLSFYANTDTEYTLTLAKTNLDEYANLHLIDLQTHTAIPLTKDTTTYRFTARSNGNVIKRFIIANASEINLSDNKFSLLHGYVKDNSRLIISNFTTKKGTVSLYDISGKQITAKEMPVSVSEIPVTAEPGVYILDLQADGKRETIKLIVR
ncbi:MAG TPA: T9SS type A sorting domain-containing protein [Paludibacteraceae bacterium]|nr:T9SS type A sorting domain-containing protein [Paludibacteraceae bacterium]